MLKILITNAKSQILVSTIFSIRDEFDCKIIVLGYEDECIGKHLADEYVYLEDKGNDFFIEKTLELIKSKKIDIFIPHRSGERFLIMDNIERYNQTGVKIFSSSKESIIRSNNKLEFFKACEKIGLPCCKYFIADNYEDLKKAAYDLGYPKKKVVIKPLESSGSRGLRILNKKVDYKSTFYKTRADQVETRLINMKNVLGNKFEALLVCEYLPGEEYTIDCLNLDGHELIIPRIRKFVKDGITFIGKIEKNEILIDYSKKLTKELGLSTVFGFQFKKDENGIFKPIECNPRIQGTTVMTTLANGNIIADTIKILLCLPVIDKEIDWDLTYYRSYGGIGVGKENKSVNIKLK
jgi:carbamoyl-phosphate synthase large subunit